MGTKKKTKRIVPTFASPKRIVGATGQIIVRGEAVDVPDWLADKMVAAKWATLERVSRPVDPPRPAPTT